MGKRPRSAGDRAALVLVVLVVVGWLALVGMATVSVALWNWVAR